MRPPHITRDYPPGRLYNAVFTGRFNEAPAYYEGLQPHEVRSFWVDTGFNEAPAYYEGLLPRYGLSPAPATSFNEAPAYYEGLRVGS